nr:hypothetical protein HmN_000524700 [Hymenolepis microstoma]
MHFRHFSLFSFVFSNMLITVVSWKVILTLPPEGASCRLPFWLSGTSFDLREDPQNLEWGMKKRMHGPRKEKKPYIPG